MQRTREHYQRQHCNVRKRTIAFRTSAAYDPPSISRDSTLRQGKRKLTLCELEFKELKAHCRSQPLTCDIRRCAPGMLPAAVSCPALLEPIGYISSHFVAGGRLSINHKKNWWVINHGAEKCRCDARNSSHCVSKAQPTLAIV